MYQRVARITLFAVLSSYSLNYNTWSTEPRIFIRTGA